MTQFLKPAFLSLVLAAIPLAPFNSATQSSESCACAPDAAALSYSCACVLAYNFTINTVQHGTCNAPGCIAELCKWTWSIDAYLALGCGVPQYFVNGGVTTPPAGWSENNGEFHSGTNPFRLSCESTGSVAMGFNGSPCLEVDFQCADCTAH